MCSLLNFRFGIHRDKSASEGIVTFYLKTSYVQGIFCVKLVSLNLKCSKIRLQSALLYKFLICSIAPSFYSGADGLILVYDITRYEFHDVTVVFSLVQMACSVLYNSRESLHSVRRWMEDALRQILPLSWLK